MRNWFWAVLVVALLVAKPTSDPVDVLSGRVVDSRSLIPIMDARVRIDGIRNEARTDSAGTFMLRGVSARIVTIRAWRIGYYAGHGTARIPGRPFRIEIGLDPALVCLDDCPRDPIPTRGYVRVVR